jgi:hypothetical protein
MPRQRIHWNDFPGPYLQFPNVSTDDAKYIIKACSSNMGNDAYFAIVHPFEGPGVGELFNYVWNEGGAGQGADTQPGTNPPSFDISDYTPPSAVKAAVDAWNHWASTVWLVPA